jgi:hypothetical protein
MYPPLVTADMAAPLPGRAVVQSLLANWTIVYPQDVPLKHYTIHAWEDTQSPYNAISMQIYEYNGKNTGLNKIQSNGYFRCF